MSLGEAYQSICCDFHSYEFFNLLACFGVLFGIKFLPACFDFLLKIFQAFLVERVKMLV